MEKPACNSCIYWEYMHKRVYSDNSEECIGVCRIRSSVDAEFPERYENDWCGEHLDAESCEKIIKKPYECS